MTYSIVRSGRWTGRTYSGLQPEHNTPDKCEMIHGEPAALLAAGKMLPPLPPEDTPEQTHEWDSVRLYHAPKPTKLGADKATVAQESARLKSLEVYSLRAIREALLVMMTPEQRATPAGKALKALDDEAATTRARLPKIPTQQGLV